MKNSVTSMYNCTHGPKRDCHACIVGELVEALEGLLAYVTEMAARTRWQPREMLPDKRIGLARALIEKAKLIEDCVPIEEAEEASRT